MALIGWKYSQKLKIQPSYIDGALSNHAVLVTEARVSVNIFTQAKSQGEDIRFTSDSAGTTEIPFEKLQFDTGLEELKYWIKIASISSTVETDFYIWWGKSSAAAYADSDPYGAENVWDDDFCGVWHMNNLTSTTVKDSTANHNNGDKDASTEPEEVVGKIYKAQDYESSNNEKITVPHDASLNFSNAFSVEAWVDQESSSTHHGIASKAHPAADDEGWWFSLDDQYTEIGVSNDYHDSSNQIGSGWRHVVGTYDESNMRHYHDGSLDDTDAETAPIVNQLASQLRLGLEHNHLRTDYFDGLLEEIRISKVRRSSDYIYAVYSNTDVPSLFILSESPITHIMPRVFRREVLDYR